MRIGMILDKVFPPDPRVENEAVSLIENKHDVFLFSLHYGNQNSIEIINGIKVKRYLSNKLEYKLSALAYTIPLYTFLMQKKIKSFIEFNKIDALHVHDIRIAQAVFNVNKKFKLPIILDLHDNLPEVMKLYPHLQKFPGKYLISPKKWKIKEEEFIKKADKIISVSPEFLHNLEERIPSSKNKLVLVPNTIRKSFYENYHLDNEIVKKYKDSFVILYLGDTNLRRGLMTAIESITELKESIVNLKLVIVGENTTDSILKEQVKKLNIEKYVDFEGWKDVSFFQSYITVSDICISPLHRNLQHDVAYANKIFQYMSFAKPLLISNAKAQKKLIEEARSGLVHLDRNVNDFTKKVLTLFNNKKLRTELGINGKKFIDDKFSWEQTSKNLINLYNNLSN